MRTDGVNELVIVNEMVVLELGGIEDVAIDCVGFDLCQFVFHGLQVVFTEILSR